MATRTWQRRHLYALGTDWVLYANGHKRGALQRA